MGLVEQAEDSGKEDCSIPVPRPVRSPISGRDVPTSKWKRLGQRPCRRDAKHVRKGGDELRCTKPFALGDVSRLPPLFPVDVRRSALLSRTRLDPTRLEEMMMLTSSSDIHRSSAFTPAPQKESAQACASIPRLFESSASFEAIASTAAGRIAAHSSASRAPKIARVEPRFIDRPLAAAGLEEE